MKIPNALINESSPYLLQHAYNPVQWYPWGDEALKQAVSQDKMLLISIGYSACHWCHVMEHESFEDDEVAELMNKHFICIKVDREERPDIDQVYMTAVQLMTGRGGWPLNCFALPDGQPVYGGTYFPKQHWKNILKNIAELYIKDRTQFLNYARELKEGIQKYEMIPALPEENEFDEQLLNQVAESWKKQFDPVEGGNARAPKFPMPANYSFLLEHFYFSGDHQIGDHVNLTLKKMAYGGIYDQIGGGFSRYSVDDKWKVPHFEKMLYDNAQLISLYANAYRGSGIKLYKEIAEHSIAFVLRELSGKYGNFYSALDADSEGIEGLFYTWRKSQLVEILGEDFELFASYYNINDVGYWEDERYILLRKDDDEQIAARFNLNIDELQKKISAMRQLLLDVRNERVRPGLDDKTLTGWNAMMITALVDAYHAFGKETYLEKALQNGEFILKFMKREDGGLFRNFKNSPTINAFLEDYAFVINAFIKLYQATFNIIWLDEAKRLCIYADRYFSDENECFYYYTSSLDPPLIARKTELHDNVIPSSNSQMAINLFYIGNYYEDDAMISRSKRMITSMKKFIASYGSSYSNWLMLWRYLSEPLREIVICGSKAVEMKNEMMKEYFSPGTIICGSEKSDNLPALKNRFAEGKTLIYICTGKTCHLPLTGVREALPLLGK